MLPWGIPLITFIHDENLLLILTLIFLLNRKERITSPLPSCLPLRRSITHSSGPPTCVAWNNCAHGWPMPRDAVACMGAHGYHLSLLTTTEACRTGHWSLTDGLTIARISCWCGSNVIHAVSSHYTVNSDYTCCAERLMLNSQAVCTAQKTNSEWVIGSKMPRSGGVKWSPDVTRQQGQIN